MEKQLTTSCRRNHHAAFRVVLLGKNATYAGTIEPVNYLQST